MVYFGSFLLNNRQIFFESSLSLGIVNIKPIVPGHILLIPKRVCPRLKDLTPSESSDLFECVYHISPILEKYYNADALNIAIQDGKVAGQSVPHVHVHMLPRKPNDFQRNDDIYEHLESQNLDQSMTETLTKTIVENADTDTDSNKNQSRNQSKVVKVEDVRIARSLEEMADEAMILRALFPNNQPTNLYAD